MDEKKKGVTVLIVVGIVVFLMMVIVTISKESKQQVSNNNDNNQSTSETYSGRYSTEYNEAFTGNETKVLYIGSSSCSVCTRFTPFMKYLSEKYNFMYYYIDAATISSTELQTVLDKVGEDINDFGTPYVVFLKDGKNVEDIPGYMSEKDLFEKLQNHGIIDSSHTYVASSSSSSSGSSNNSNNTDKNDYKNISFIGYDKYDEIYQSGKKSIIVLGQTGCGACTAYKPVIDEIAKEKNIEIYYVDMTQLESGEPTKLMNSLSYFDEVESWGTPLTLIIENKKVVAAQLGHNEKETTLEFFKNNGFTK